MPVPAPDIADGTCVLKPDPRLLNFLPIGSGAERGLLGRHADRDDMLWFVCEQVGVGLPYKRMPMPQPYIHAIPANV
jgi:hypothetical protein